MATASQIASMTERAKNPPPPAQREPTNASLPIMGPPTAPMVRNFSAPPLTPAQRAVQTRQQRAAGILPAKADQPAKATQARPDGLDLVLIIAPTATGMLITFRFDRATESVAIPPGETSIPLLRAISPRNKAGDLEPASGVTFASSDATEHDLAVALPLMRRLTGVLLGAYDESEDRSFPQMVLTLASALRVSRIETAQPDGTVTTAKRGAAYISAFKAGEAHKPATGS
jgi:hypothetical protein